MRPPGARLPRSAPSESPTQPQRSAHAPHEARGNRPPYGPKWDRRTFRDEIVRDRPRDFLHRSLLDVLAAQEDRSRHPDPVHADALRRFHNLRRESRHLASRRHKLSPTRLHAATWISKPTRGPLCTILAPGTTPSCKRLFPEEVYCCIGFKADLATSRNPMQRELC